MRIRQKRGENDIKKEATQNIYYECNAEGKTRDIYLNIEETRQTLVIKKAPECYASNREESVVVRKFKWFFSTRPGSQLD